MRDQGGIADALNYRLTVIDEMEKVDVSNQLAVVVMVLLLYSSNNGSMN